MQHTIISRVGNVEVADRIGRNAGDLPSGGRAWTAATQVGAVGGEIVGLAEHTIRGYIRQRCIEFEGAVVAEVSDVKITVGVKCNVVRLA